MALSSWTEKLVDAYQRTADLGRKQELGDGIVRGLTERTEPSLATREFTAKVQIVGALRNGECVLTRFDLSSSFPHVLISLSIGYSQRRDIREGQHRSAKRRCNFRIQVYLALSQLEPTRPFNLVNMLCFSVPSHSSCTSLSFNRHSHYCHLFYFTLTREHPSCQTEEK